MTNFTELKIKNIQENLLNKSGYCLTELGNWVIERFKSKVEEDGFIISGEIESYISCLELSEHSNIEEFLEKYIKNDENGFFLKCLNTWEKFISNECPEFDYNKDVDDMEHSLYLKFMDKKCDDTFLSDYFCSQKLREIIILYK